MTLQSRLSTILCAVLLVGTVDCGPPSTDDKPFELMVISDLHVTDHDSQAAMRLRQLVTRLNSNEFSNVDMLVATGDMADSLWATEPPPSNDNYLRTAMSILADLKMPMLPVIGNHEYNFVPDHRADNVQELEHVAQIWRRETQHELYYSVEHKGFRLVVMDNFRGRVLEDNAYFDEAQLQWFEGLLAKPMPTLVFVHYPVHTDSDVYWTMDLSNIVEPTQSRFHSIVEKHKDQIRNIFVGHGHSFARDRLYDDVLVYETAALGLTFITTENYHLIHCDPANGTTRVRAGKGAAYVN